MRKIIAFATLALGVILGTAGTASAYPPVGTPTITGPQTVAPSASVTVTVSDAPAGTVAFTFEGTTTEVPVVAGGAAFAPLQSAAGGSASVNLTAPAAVGTYPVTAALSDGSSLSTTITVVAGGGGGTNGGGTNGGEPAAGKGGGLPNTGGVVLPLVGLGLATLAGGFSLVYVSKRRRAIA